MKRFVLTRLAALVPISLIVSFFTFLLTHLLPGNPVDVICGTGCTAAGHAQLAHQMGLDRPILTQYWLYLDHVAHGNLGKSYLDGETVAHALGQQVPATLELVLASQILAVLVALPLAIFSALRPGARFDRVSAQVSYGFFSLPAMVLGVFLVEVFAIKIHGFPATGYTALTANPIQNLHDMVLPVITFGVGSVAIYYRILRSDLVATFQEDYITMARAKGLPTRYIVLRHGLRPSLLNFVTLAAQSIGFQLSGAFIIEFLFQIPGLAYGMINAIGSSDYLRVQGTVLVITISFVVLNLAADVLNAFLDPRIRRQGAAA